VSKFRFVNSQHLGAVGFIARAADVLLDDFAERSGVEVEVAFDGQAI
jgi:hypothetical protein